MAGQRPREARAHARMASAGAAYEDRCAWVTFAGVCTVRSGCGGGRVCEMWRRHGRGRDGARPTRDRAGQAVMVCGVACAAQRCAKRAAAEKVTPRVTRRATKEVIFR